MRIIRQDIPSPVKAVRKQIWTGSAIIGVTFFGLGGWAATAPLSSAAVATGQVIVSSMRQTVQHLEGGIISEIAIHDGDRVEAGQVLIRLENAQAGAAYDLVEGQYLAAIGEKARLEAERDGLPEIEWPVEFRARVDDDKIKEIVRGQTNVFKSDRDYLGGQLRLVDERKLQARQEIEGLKAQVDADDAQTKLLDDERSDVASLLQQGLASRPRLLALDRAKAQLQGQRGDLVSQVARAEQSMSEMDAQLSDLKNKVMTQVVSDLRAGETRIGDLTEKLKASKDVLDRLSVRAPKTGHIVNLAFHTVGGVVQPGAPILDVVPDNEALLIEVQFDPKDIDGLKIGSHAEVTLTAYSRRSVPPISGVLVMLSADSIANPQKGTSYYVGKVEVSERELAQLSGVKLVPGMPAQVMVETGERTALDYLLAPLEKSIHRALRES